MKLLHKIDLILLVVRRNKYRIIMINNKNIRVLIGCEINNTLERYLILIIFTYLTKTSNRFWFKFILVRILAEVKEHVVNSKYKITCVAASCIDIQSFSQFSSKIETSNKGKKINLENITVFLHLRGCFPYIFISSLNYTTCNLR